MVITSTTVPLRLPEGSSIPVRSRGTSVYVGLLQRLLIAPRYVLPALELLLFVRLIAVNPTRLTRATPKAASSPTWNYVTAAGTLRGPHPKRPRHRPARPAP
ncbi:hypothetical protein ACFWFI_29270, partial [Streptomyces sp. NPDC060209]